MSFCGQNQNLSLPNNKLPKNSYFYRPNAITMNRIKTFALILLSAIGFAAFGQEDVSIGHWRTHLPFRQVIDVELFGNKVYAATPFELFYYDQDDNSVNILNKINGLSDVGVSTIRYNQKQNLLFVGYTDANVDLIYADGSVKNMSDIKDKTILGNKTINNVFFNEEFAYVACGFGIVVFDLKRCEVKDTYYIGAQGSMMNVKDIAFYDGRIYASTDEGLYSAPRDAQNLANFASWRFERDLIHPHLAYGEMEAFANKLFLNYNGGFNMDTVFVYDGSRWDYFEKGTADVRQELRSCGDRFLMVTQYNIFMYDEQMQQVMNVYNPGGKINPLSATVDDKNTYWIGDSQRGIVKTTGWDNEDIVPNGPFTKSVFQLQSCGNHVWVATGGHASNWSPRYMKEGVFRFDGSWTSYNRSLSPDFGSYSDFVCTATDPKNPSVTYVGTWGYGVMKLKDGQLVEVYNAENSTLDYWTADPSLILISGLAFDSKGNLWVANSGANDMLSVMEPNGTWHSFNLGGTFSGLDISWLYVDTHDIKWIIRRVGQQDSQTIVFDDNGTFDVTSDDKVKGLTKSVGGLPGNMVNCIAVDKNNGRVWLGTDIGPCYFDDSRRLFTEPSYKADRPRVDRNDGTHQYDLLFDGSNVLSMAIDGGGNKWFGLETGVNVVDDSQAEIALKHTFTTANSPLLDNAVKAMAINADGEVFMGSDNGIVSYKGEASDPDPVVTDVIAYPNPVRPDYNGYVGIKGLANDSRVRITTVDGGFVTELWSEGGQAVWDCTTADGRKVTPGVYLIFVSTDDGQNRFATKILVMN